MTTRFTVVPASYVLLLRDDPADVHPLVSLHRTSGTPDPLDERVDWFFTCRRWRGEPRPLEPHKNAELAWFGLDALPAPIPPHELFVLDGLRRGDLPPVVCFGFPGSPGYPPQDGRTPVRGAR